MSAPRPLRCVVLISGRGSNLAALIEAKDKGILALEIAQVISNKPSAAGLIIAQRAGINSSCIETKDFSDKTSFDLQLQQLIDAHSPDLIILAGFMRILTAPLVAHFHQRIINLHPSLLPKYPGLDTYNRVLEAGDSEYGASIHFVTQQLDAGTVISQVELPVMDTDTAASLAERLQPMEHKLLVATLRLLSTSKVTSKNDMLVVDEKTHTKPFILASDSHLHATDR